MPGRDPTAPGFAPPGAPLARPPVEPPLPPPADRRVVVSVAGLDPSGGAGLAADARVIAREGFHPGLVCTALTAQGERGVSWWEPASPEAVIAQLRAVLATGPVAAVKVGMVGDVALVPPLVEALGAVAGLPVVYDPVLAASAGRPLLAGDLAALWPLLRRATVVTPNLDELAALSGLPVSPKDPASARAAARALSKQGVAAVLAKGGHLEGDPMDVLDDGARFHAFPGERIDAGPVRGTGCVLSAALACALARGEPLPEAVGSARRALRAALTRAYGLGGRLRYLP